MRSHRTCVIGGWGRCASELRGAQCVPCVGDESAGQTVCCGPAFRIDYAEDLMHAHTKSSLEDTRSDINITVWVIEAPPGISISSLRL